MFIIINIYHCLRISDDAGTVFTSISALAKRRDATSLDQSPDAH